MKKAFKLISSIATIFIFVACGSSQGSSRGNTSSVEKISNRDVVSINYHYSSEICSSSEFKNYMKEMISFGKDFIFSVESNSVRCETYGKINNGNECNEQDSNNYYSTSCVIALNMEKSNYNKELLKESTTFIAKEVTNMLEAY